MEKTIKVNGMHCKSCEVLLTDSLSEIPGIEQARADSKKGTVTIRYNDARLLGEAKKAIEKEGYVVV